jgi:hypothetical protein
VALAPLADWNNFYLIAGTSAGGLTGLTFVVIALAADGRRVNPTGTGTFITPTVTHFGTVLGLAAFLCVPGQAVLSVALALGAVGIGGLVYVGVIAANIHRNRGAYVAVIEDWIWNVVLPGITYGGFCVMALLMPQHFEAALYGVGAGSMALLFIGIHNAWDIAIWISLRKQQEPRE